MTRIVACMNIYNEASTLEKCLESITELVDEIIVVDGRYKDFPGEQVASDDGSLEIIKKFSNVKLIQCNEKLTQAQKRSKYLEYLDDGDWALIMDGDEEFVFNKSVAFIRDEIVRHDNVIAYYMKEVVDISGSTDWWPVIIRYRKGYYYDDEVNLVNEQGHKILMRPPGTRAVFSVGFYHFQEDTLPIYDAYLHHHKFGRPGERLAQKFEYWKKMMALRKLNKK